MTTTTDDVAHAHEVWLSMARPLAYGLLAGEISLAHYNAGDRARAIAHTRIAIGHVANADVAALDALDAHPDWSTCAQHVHDYTLLHVAGLESMLGEIRRGHRLQAEPTRAQARDLQRMFELQTLAVANARTLIADLGGNPDLAIPPGSIYLELKAQAATPWPEIEN